MNITQLSVFIDVMRLGSFARVAKKNNTSPSTVSRAIAGLEDDLKIRLFERNTRTLVPTAPAQNLQNKIEPLLEELKLSLYEAGDETFEVSGPLRITSPVSLGLTHMVKAVNDFNKLYPKVDVEFLMSDSRMDIIAEKIDVALRFGQLEDSNYISQKLAPLTYAICATPKYIKKHGAPKKPKDISDHNCVTFLLNSFRSGWKFRKPGDSRVQEYPIKSNLLITNAIALKEATLLGQGIAMLPRFLVKEELQKNKLIDLFPNYQVAANSFETGIWLIFPSRKYLPKRTRAFIGHLKSKLDLAY